MTDVIKLDQDGIARVALDLPVAPLWIAARQWCHQVGKRLDIARPQLVKAVHRRDGGLGFDLAAGALEQQDIAWFDRPRVRAVPPETTFDALDAAQDTIQRVRVDKCNMDGHRNPLSLYRTRRSSARDGTRMRRFVRLAYALSSAIYASIAASSSALQFSPRRYWARRRMIWSLISIAVICLVYQKCMASQSYTPCFVPMGLYDCRGVFAWVL